jgi:hypothetical protein
MIRLGADRRRLIPKYFLMTNYCRYLPGMKVIALMMTCLVFLSLLPGEVKTMPISAKSHCQMSPHWPCKPQHTNDCRQGTCSTMLCCSLCGFINAELVTIKAPGVVVTDPAATPYHVSHPADYFPSNWNPPKV